MLKKKKAVYTKHRISCTEKKTLLGLQEGEVGNTSEQRSFHWPAQTSHTQSLEREKLRGEDGETERGSVISGDRGLLLGERTVKEHETVCSEYRGNS